MEYPLFIPPLELAKKPPKDWTCLEAKAYFEWFLGNIENRITGLILFLGLNQQTDAIKLLQIVQEKFEGLMDEAWFSLTESGTKRLSNQGYAFAADIGLLLAKQLITARNEAVRWEILKKPKSDSSYNLPVLVYLNGTKFDPVAVSIADATSILRGNKKEDAWVKVFQFLIDVK